MKPLLSLLFFFILYAQAEIYKVAQQCAQNNEICFYHWPQLQPIVGWQQDMDYSFYYGMNAQAPEGVSFKDAETVIYANALYKPSMPEVTSIEQFIANDKANFLHNDPGMVITQTTTLKDRQGRNFISYQFKPGQKNQSWEQIAYSEETDADGNHYYLVFVLNSRTESGYQKNIAVFNRFVSEYR